MDFGYEVKLLSLDDISELTMKLLQLEGVQSVVIKEK